jgi:hypothetical protein
MPMKARIPQPGHQLCLQPPRVRLTKRKRIDVGPHRNPPARPAAPGIVSEITRREQQVVRDEPYPMYVSEAVSPCFECEPMGGPIPDDEARP